ncbi:MAG: type II CAAX endopeptidase family protein [Clostridium sp.]|nr:type II CAAX endopeptidase family protein [Clostridium sp.]
MKKVFGVNIYFLALVLLQIFGGYLIRPIIPFLRGKVWLALLTTQILFLLVPIIIYIIITRQSPVKVLRFKMLSGKNLIYSIIVGILIEPIAGFLGIITSFVFRNNVDDVLGKMTGLPLWAFVGIIALTPAICEEMTVRGVILSGYKKMNINKVAIITGLMFAILHMNPPQFLYTFAIGIILAHMVDATDSIFSSMICHFIFNGINAASAWHTFRSLSKINSTVPPSSSIIMLFIISAICVWLIAIIIGKIRRNKKESVASLAIQEVDLQHEKDDILSKIVGYSPILLSAVIYVLTVIKE